MSIFPPEIEEAASKLGGEFVKGSEFEGDGLTLQLVKAMEVVKSNNPKYGATETDFLVKNDILEEGETLRFTFKDSEGKERTFDTKSAPFFIAVKQVEELGVGDWIHITRTGKTNETRYQAEKVAGVSLRNEEIDPKEIPF